MASSTILIPYRRDTCLCGCGGRPRRGSLHCWGHVRLSTREQREAVWRELHANAPQCACGCGTPVRPGYSDFDAWVRNGCLSRYNQYADGHANCTSNQLLQLEEKEKQAILGTLLGDSSIGYPHRYSKSPILYSTHGYVQKEWAEYKAAFLHRLNPKTRIAKNDGWGELSVRTSTPCNPALRAIHDLVIKGHGKAVSREWLDGIGDVGLAWWLCDDGSATHNGLSLHTEGFSKTENELIADWFCDNIGKATVGYVKRKDLYCIHIASWTQIEVGRRVAPHVPECMRYKLVPCDENRPRKGNGRIRHRSRREPLFFCQQPACP